ncbi:hypothetical protein RchiOBHm_Chr4g0385421 [Rosa chinensis]|uniref:Uncharacterized protein n=1 Tax=Rosa chinensis TaxID=74649 RepID=A0A2P6QNX3_ROSCH|nr:hypothetical protein RchiOBHm_Chr4g0385421 [Rosa chinensis]
MWSKVFSVTKALPWIAISSAFTRTLTFGSTAYFFYRTVPLFGEVMKSQKAANEAFHQCWSRSRTE